MMQDKTVVSVLEAVDQYFYCIFVYMMVLCLLKPLIWPRLKFDNYIYFISLIPPSLNMILRQISCLSQIVINNTGTVPYLRLTVIFTKIPNHATQSAVNTAVNVLSSFIIYHLPLTVVLISTITTSRSDLTSQLQCVVNSQF